MEESRVLDLVFLQQRLHTVRPLREVDLVDARERQDATWVDSNTLNSELLSREVTTLNKEGLVDVVGDAGEEFHLNLEALLGQHLASHVTALDDSLAAQRAQVDVELEGDLSDVLDEKVTRLALVVGNLSEVELVGAELEGDIAGLTLNRHIVVGATINAHDSHTTVGEAVSSVESELNVL